MAEPTPNVSQGAGPEALAELLRTCVQCGLCLPHCATWLATGSEVQSPRGRLVLLDDLYRGGRADPEGGNPAAYLVAFDQCIGCRACETACPSGVPFSLLEHGQELAAAKVLPESRPAVPDWILRRMDRVDFLRFLSRTGYLVRGFLKVIAGNRWRTRLAAGSAFVSSAARLLGTMPRAPRDDRELAGRLRALGLPDLQEGPLPSTPRSQAVFFRGCANAGFLPAVSRRLIEVLRWAGFEVTSPDGQQCCGALAEHTGRPGRAAALRTAHDNLCDPLLTEGTVLVVEAAGCGHELKSRAARPEAVRDAVELLASVPLPALGSMPLKVALHDPCHARHAQGLVAEPRRLLGLIPGVEVLEPAEAEVCCGSGGAWGLRYPDISAELGLRKAQLLAATGADVIVTANPGCLGQIADGLALLDDAPPILPLTDLLWYAAGLARS